MNENGSQTFGEKVKGILHKIIEKKVIVFSVIGVAAIASGIVVFVYQSGTEEGSVKQRGQMAGVSGNNIMMEYVTASGTTSLGYTVDEFEPDYIETELYIEEVYLSSGDEVTEGTAVFKISEESIAEAREELEEKKEETSLAYRAGLISYEQSKINAKYTYDTAILEGQQAEAVYNSAIKDAEEKLQLAKDNVTDAEEKIEEYTNANASYYYKYNVDKYKERYETNESFYYALLGEWGFSESDLNGSGMGGQSMTSGSQNQSAEAGSTTDGTGQETDNENSSDGDDESGSGDGDGGSGDGSGDGDGGSGDGSGDGDGGSGDGSGDGDGGSGDGSGDGSGSDSGSTNSISEDNSGSTESILDETALSLFADWNTTLARLTSSTSLGDGLSLMNVTSTNQTDTDYTRRLQALQQMKKNVESSQNYYYKAWDEYEAAANQATSQLKKLEIQMESLRADLAEAEKDYQLEILEAETTYKKSLAQTQLAQSDYDAAMQKANDELETLEDEKTEAEENLAEFEALLGDGYFYTQNAGTVMMLGVRSTYNLQGGSMVVAYRNTEDISVTVSVSQEDINKLEVGDSAQVIIEDYGTFEGQITYLNPISNSDSRTNITYEVMVDLNGDNISSLKENLTATVIFQTGDSSQ